MCSCSTVTGASTASMCVCVCSFIFLIRVLKPCGSCMVVPIWNGRNTVQHLMSETPHSWEEAELMTCCFIILAWLSTLCSVPHRQCCSRAFPGGSLPLTGHGLDLLSQNVWVGAGACLSTSLSRSCDLDLDLELHSRASQLSVCPIPLECCALRMEMINGSDLRDSDESFCPVSDATVISLGNIVTLV
jgi:hypothetical protein